MAAPDIDAGVFKQIANPLLPSATQITIYESSKDRALEVSHTFHRYPRLGDTDPSIHVFKDYQCIEATSVDAGLIGHSYIGDSASILSDIFDLIRNGASANERFRLTEHTLDGLPYWSFKK
jgi:esterase/lipase superfamily enzyme